MKINTNDCWLYAGRVDSQKEYGIINGHFMAHRVMYENMVGEIPTGLVIDHLCRVRRCINPTHLEPVTNGENVLRGISPAAINKRKTHCSVGHEFTSDNTYTRPSGMRRCRKCHVLSVIATRTASPERMGRYRAYMKHLMQNRRQSQLTHKEN